MKESVWSVTIVNTYTGRGLDLIFEGLLPVYLYRRQRICEDLGHLTEYREQVFKSLTE